MASERDSPPEQPETFIAHSEVAHTGEELTEAEGSTILRLESSEIAPLPSQVLGGDAAVTAIHSAASTSPGLKTLDASADRGSDIGADQQLTGNEPDSTGEPERKVSSQTLEGTDIDNPNMKDSVTLTEIPSLKESSTDDRELVSNEDGSLRTPIAPLVTFLRTAPVISLAGTSETRSIERSET